MQNTVQNSQTVRKSLEKPNTDQMLYRLPNHHLESDSAYRARNVPAIVAQQPWQRYDQSCVDSVPSASRRLPRPSEMPDTDGWRVARSYAQQNNPTAAATVDGRRRRYGVCLENRTWTESENGFRFWLSIAGPGSENSSRPESRPYEKTDQFRYVADPGVLRIGFVASGTTIATPCGASDHAAFRESDPAFAAG